MRVRAVDENGDMRFGQGQADFLHDSPEAVAQVVESRLHLWVEDWYLDRSAGTPYQTRVLGKRTEGTRDVVMRDRILSSPGVTRISKYDSTLERTTRGFTVNATIVTAYSASANFGRAANSADIATSVYFDR